MSELTANDKQLEEENFSSTINGDAYKALLSVMLQKAFVTVDSHGWSSTEYTLDVAISRQVHDPMKALHTTLTLKPVAARAMTLPRIQIQHSLEMSEPSTELVYPEQATLSDAMPLAVVAAVVHKQK